VKKFNYENHDLSEKPSSQYYVQNEGFSINFLIIRNGFVSLWTFSVFVGYGAIVSLSIITAYLIYQLHSFALYVIIRLVGRFIRERNRSLMLQFDTRQKKMTAMFIK
jgi:hypothetical protein